MTDSAKARELIYNAIGCAAASVPDGDGRPSHILSSECAEIADQLIVDLGFSEDQHPLPPRPVPPGRCRSCPAAVAWFTTTNNKSVLVNRGSIDEATLEWGIDKHGYPAPIFNPKVHEVHFITCPKADQHRRR